MPVPFEGTANYPKDTGSIIGAGWYNAADGFFYAPRADNATAKNLRVALYDASGNALLVTANPGYVKANDGDLGGIGATTDAIVAAGAAGSTSAKLRRVTQGLEDLKSLIVLAAGSNVIGEVSVDQTTPGTTDRVTVGGMTAIAVAPTVSTTPAYTAGDAVGGKLTLASAVRLSGGNGLIQSVVLADKGKQSVALDVVFFNADPSGTTFTDNGALTIADADLLKIVGHVSVAAADYSAFVDNSVATKAGLGLAFKLASGTSLYACIVARGTPTYTSTSDVQLLVSILED